MIRSLLFLICYVLFLVGFLIFLIGSMLFVIWSLLFVIGSLLFLIGFLLYLTGALSSVICSLSSVKCSISSVICSLSSVICSLSSVIILCSLLFVQGSGESWFHWCCGKRPHGSLCDVTEEGASLHSEYQGWVHKGKSTTRKSKSKQTHVLYYEGGHFVSISEQDPNFDQIRIVLCFSLLRLYPLELI